MIIVDRYKDNERAFAEANPGDCFVWDDDYYMKLEKPCAILTLDGIDVDANAVELRNGKIYYFPGDTKVTAIRLKAEVY